MSYQMYIMIQSLISSRIIVSDGMECLHLTYVDVMDQVNKINALFQAFKEILVIDYYFASEYF